MMTVERARPKVALHHLKGKQNLRPIKVVVSRAARSRAKRSRVDATMKPMPTLLIVEDDPMIGPGLLGALTAAGIDATLAASCAEAIRAADTPPQVVLLDLGLPDGDGIDLCRVLRARLPAAAILVVTARADEMDVVLALDAGADDHIAKPFRLAELLARVRANLRRFEATGGPVSVGAMCFDPAARRVTVNGVEIELRVKEFDLLARLVATLGIVVTRERLMADVWDEHWFGSTKTLDMTISSLRRKLGTSGDAITTIRGVGYRMDDLAP